MASNHRGAELCTGLEREGDYVNMALGEKLFCEIN